MQVNFENAKKLYQNKLRPMLGSSAPDRPGGGPGGPPTATAPGWLYGDDGGS